MLKKVLATLGVVAALSFIPTTAQALDCTNASRPAYTGTDYTAIPAGPGQTLHVHLDGNWAYVLEFGMWTFLPPGTVPEGPGANGNFHNNRAAATEEEFAYALLVQGFCQSGGVDSRQTTKGIQLDHGCPPAP